MKTRLRFVYGVSLFLGVFLFSPPWASPGKGGGLSYTCHFLGILDTFLALILAGLRLPSAVVKCRFIILLLIQLMKLLVFLKKPFLEGRAGGKNFY